MSRKNRDSEALSLIYNFWRENNRSYPTSSSVAKKMNISISHFGNLRRRLFRKELLTKSIVWEFELTEKACEALESNLNLGENFQTLLKENPPVSKIVRKQKQSKPLEYIDFVENVQQNLRDDADESNLLRALDIPIYGQVRAGKNTETDDLIVDLSPSGDTLPIPDIDAGQKVYALEVVGDSMLSEHIVEGDYVIVEQVSLMQIKEGDLIVASYLKEKFNTIDQKSFNYATKIPNNYGGPTLKYYSRSFSNRVLPSGEKEPIHVLSVRRGKDMEINQKNTIRTRYLEPDSIGRVIAVHRSVRRL